MKKLMIAAAAAAMIGGAQADLAYDYSTSLKTTVGKGGSQQTVKVNLGMDDADQFWYEDAGVMGSGLYTIKKVTNGGVTTYRKYDLNGNYIEDLNDTPKTYSGIFSDYNGYEACVTYTKNKYGYIGKLNSNFNALENWEKALCAEGLSDDGTTSFVNRYNLKSGGKWCASFSYKAGAECYRAAGSMKQKAIVRVEDCCADEFMDEDGNYTIGFVLNNRFGSTVLSKATKIEVCGYVNDFCDANAVDQYTLAGQGTWSDKLVKDSNGDYLRGISSISGNIVGVVAAPDCVTCCQNPTDAVAWSCDEVEDASLPSAAYGTWTLKFNKKNSDL